MRLKISKEQNVIQAGHSKISFWIPQGQYTLYESVDAVHWSTLDASCDASTADGKTVNIGGITPTAFVKIVKSDDQAWEGVAIGCNKLD